MAENETSQEKTEEPTPKRLRDAQDKGQVASSKELNTTLVLLAGSGTLLMLGGDMLNRIQELIRRSFMVDRARIFDPAFMLTALEHRIAEALLVLAPMMVILVVAAIVGPVVMGGGRFRPQGMAPKPDKLSPIKGIKRIFGPQGAMELGKTLAKFSLISAVASLLLWTLSGRIVGLGAQDMVPGVVHAGKPEVKSKIRQTQQEISQRRMMGEVPKADVVVTNPTHYAVALKYDQSKMGAPRVVARGVDEVAAEIRQTARVHRVPLFSAPPLARALFFSTRLDQEIPAGLYVAVAQVLAYVYQLRHAHRQGAEEPPPPDDLPVPSEFLKRDPTRGEEQ
jgi:flagellar biosynthetic protein FlhB